MDEKNNGALTGVNSQFQQIGQQNIVQTAATDYNLSEMIKIGQFLAQLLTSKIPITQKLCSKKLWLAIAGVLFGFIGQRTSVDTLSALMNTGLEIVSILIYILSEASVDKARAVQNTATVELLDTMTMAVAQIPQREEDASQTPPVG